ERARAVRQQMRGQAARRDAEGDGPRVVDRRRLGKRNLADDLGPHVERGVRVLPGFVWKGGPLGAQRDDGGHARAYHAKHADHLCTYRPPHRPEAFEYAWVRRMRKTRLAVAAPPHVSALGGDALLCLPPQPPCQQTRPRREPPGCYLSRAGRAVAVLLPR